jgi:CubicO group peptidase (beta-lactamase class C family)
VSDHLRAYRIVPARADAPPVTLRHVLTHTGGIGELRSARDLPRPVIGLGARADRPVPTPREYYAGGLRAEVPPGTKWAYANHAYATLGQVIEDVSGEPFAAYMRRHVLDPLGMAHSDYDLSDRVRDRLAQGYAFHRGRLRPVDYLEIVVRGAGSMFSTVDDLARYVSALLGEGRNAHGVALRPATLRQMWEPWFQLDPRLLAMGLGFVLERYGSHRVVGHDGGWPGFVSSLLVASDDGLGVIALGNTSSAAPSAVSRALLRHLLGLPDPRARLPRRGVPEVPSLWPELCGTYGPAPGPNTNARFWAGFGGEAEVRVSGGHLALRSLVGPFWRGLRLYPVDPADPLAFEAVYQKQVIPLVFQRNAQARVDRLCLNFDTLYQRPALASLRVRVPAVAGGLGGLALAAAGLRRWPRR